MKVTKFLPVATAAIVALGLWGFVYVGDAAGGGTGICVTPEGRNVPCNLGGGSSSSGGGGGEGGIKRWFRERKERYEREREEERRNEQEYKATVERWSQKVESNKEQYIADQERNAKVQRDNLLKARQTAEVMNAWNDIGIEAYRAGDWGNAITYFKAAHRYGPNSSDIQHNLQRAESKLSAKAENYLSSLNTVLDIAYIAPHLLIFHPDPNVRAEANKKLARKALDDTAEAAAAFVAEERLNGGKIKPFPWETEAERMARRSSAIRHAERIDSLRLEALKEARELAELVIVSDPKEDIRIQTKPATEQLLKICISGFE
jgi:hypothetical protein